MKKLKSSIVVKRKVISTEGVSAKSVETVTPRRNTPTKTSKKCSESIKNFSQTSASFKPGKGMWKNVPSAIRYATLPVEQSVSRNDPDVDEKLDEMCFKAFVSGELDNRAYTLEEIGQYCGISRERVRQIEAQAMRNLRNHIHAKFGWEMSYKDLKPDHQEEYRWMP